MIKKKKDTIKSLAIHAKDVGSTEIQIGLLTDKVKPLYDELGVLDYQDWPTDGEIDWASLSRPLDQSEEVEEDKSFLFKFIPKVEE